MGQGKERKQRAESGLRERFVWIVTLQDSGGVVQEVEYGAYWSPEKTESGDVAQACAIENSYFGPKDADGNPSRHFVPIAARLAA